VWIFTDADVHWRDGALDALLARWRVGEHAFASVWLRQRTVGWLERIAVPQVDMILLGGLPWPLVPRLPFPSLAAGNGQLMAWTPAAYRAAGGHAAVRDVVLEDVRMAQRAKAAEVTPYLALGADLVETRMYRTASEVLDGFAKNVLPAAGSWPALILLVALNALAYLASWPLILVEGRWALVAAAGLALRGGVAAIVGRSPWEAALQPLAPLALIAVVARVAARRGGYVWRGRRYARGRS
jgi:chlorobactene glucosyltransferase